jgi:hypothetical protein
MSLFFIFFRRFHCVRDRLEILIFLTPGRLSCRDDSDRLFIFFFRVRYRDYVVAKKPKGNEPILSVVKAVVDNRGRDSREYSFHVAKVDTVLFEVRPPLQPDRPVPVRSSERSNDRSSTAASSVRTICAGEFVWAPADYRRFDQDGCSRSAAAPYKG